VSQDAGSLSDEMIYESSHSKNNVSLLETSSPSNCIENKNMFTNKHCKQILITSGHLGDNIQDENIEQSQEYTQRGKKRIKLKKNLIVHSRDKYGCSYCGLRFTQSGSLSRHIRDVHSGGKSYECTQCGKKFTRSGNLETHMLVHSGEKRYECTQCGKKFTKSCDLKSHLRVHSGEKPYECTQCGKKFTQSGHLKMHMLVHSGDKRYKCTQCGKKFNYSGGLKYHMSKKRSCITSSSRSQLKRHIPTPSPEKLFECRQCSGQFNSTNHLIKHIRSHCGHLKSRKTRHLNGIANKSPSGKKLHRLLLIDKVSETYSD